MSTVKRGDFLGILYLDRAVRRLLKLDRQFSMLSPPRASILDNARLGLNESANASDSSRKSISPATFSSAAPRDFRDTAPPLPASISLVFTVGGDYFERFSA